MTGNRFLLWCVTAVIVIVIIFIVYFFCFYRLCYYSSLDLESFLPLTLGSSSSLFSLYSSLSLLFPWFCYPLLLLGVSAGWLVQATVSFFLALLLCLSFLGFKVRRLMLCWVASPCQNLFSACRFIVWTTDPPSNNFLNAKSLIFYDSCWLFVTRLKQRPWQHQLNSSFVAYDLSLSDTDFGAFRNRLGVHCRHQKSLMIQQNCHPPGRHCFQPPFVSESSRWLWFQRDHLRYPSH
jgi:hypothetical protein